MNEIHILVLLMASALCSAFSITDDSTDFENNVERSNQVSNECLPFPKPADCEEVRLNNGNRTSGVYTIWPRNRKMACKSVEVFCDMKTDGGGWTVLQRRGNYGSAMNYFHKNWEFYKNGFGQLDKEFWIGNDVIYALTNQGSYSVRFDMRLANGTSAYALYDQFWIEDEDRKYQLHIAGYSGNAGDSMSHHQAMKFSTPDNDNDKLPVNCAAENTGGWWFNDCLKVHLNGLYKPGEQKYDVQKGKYANGIHWMKFSGFHNSMDFTEIKIRPRYFK